MAFTLTKVADLQVESTSTPTLTCSSGSFNAGDLIIIVISKDDNDAVSGPSGFTELFTGQAWTSHMRTSGFYKAAVTADETATSYACSGDLEDYCAVLLRVTDANTVPVELLTTAGPNDTAPDTAATTSNDSGSIIVGGFGCDSGGSATVPVAVSGTLTSLFADQSSTSSGGCALAIGHYKPASTSIPQLIHSASAAEQNVAFVFEVKPAAGATTASGAATIGALTASGSAEETGVKSATGAATVGALTASGTASKVSTATSASGAAALQALTASGSVTSGTAVSVSGAASVPAIIAEIYPLIRHVFSGSGAGTAAALTASGSIAINGVPPGGGGSPELKKGHGTRLGLILGV